MISPTTAFLAGLQDYLRAWRLVRRERLWPWLVLPGLVSLAYFPGILIGTLFYAEDAEPSLRGHWLPAFLQKPVFSWLITAALWLACLYAGFILFRHVIMFLAGHGFIDRTLDRHGYRVGPSIGLARR